MSFRDTLNGAREELNENRDAYKKSEETIEQDVQEEPKSTGFEKKSVTRAKPAREAAAGVRVVTSSGKVKKASGTSKPRSEMTKEEKRAQRQKERDAEDRRTMAAQALLKKDPIYQKWHGISMGMIVAGLVCTALSWVIAIAVPDSQTDLTSFWGVMAIVMLVVAYIGVIGGFIMDWARLHKVRNMYNDRVRSLKEKQLNAIIEQSYQEVADKPSFFDRFRKKKEEK